MDDLRTSSVEDVIEAIRIVNKFDRRDRLVILRVLQKQNLSWSDLTKEPVKEKEGGEQ